MDVVSKNPCLFRLSCALFGRGKLEQEQEHQTRLAQLSIAYVHVNDRTSRSFSQRQRKMVSALYHQNIKRPCSALTTWYQSKTAGFCIELKALSKPPGLDAWVNLHIGGGFGAVAVAGAHDVVGAEGGGGDKENPVKGM